MRDWDLYIQSEELGGVVLSVLDEFGFAVSEAPMEIGGETVELPTRQWAGVDGEDVYIPPVIPLQAYDWEIKLVTREKSPASNAVGLRDWLRSMGYLFKVYNPYLGITRRGCHFKSISDPEYYRSADGSEAATVSLTLRVTDPSTRLAVLKDSAGNITDLTISRAKNDEVGN